MSSTDTNQASELYELCKEVYDRTEWDSGFIRHALGDEIFDRVLFESDINETHPRESYIPLYTSDYLLEKLPDTLGLYRDEMSHTKWQAAVEDGISFKGVHVECGDVECECDSYFGEGDTPLKALLKLTIALSEAGELK